MNAVTMSIGLGLCYFISEISVWKNIYIIGICYEQSLFIPKIDPQNWINKSGWNLKIKPIEAHDSDFFLYQNVIPNLK